MDSESRLANLLLAWCDAYERGHDIPAAELCRSCPELIAMLASRIAAQKTNHWLQQNSNAGMADARCPKKETTMDSEDRLAELLLQWEDAYEMGVDVPAVELCKSCPELTAALHSRILAQKANGWLRSRPPSSSPASLDTRNRQTPKTPRFEPGYRPLPGYTLEAYLGSGGFGEVWSAVSLDGPVAVKLIHAGSGDAGSKRRLAIECGGVQKVASISHPLIVRVLQVCEVDNSLVIVTELAEASLDERFERLRERCSPLDLCLYAYCLLRDIAEALDFLQAKHDLMHLDIKPANLLLVEGVCKLCDFGTVKRLRYEQSRAAAPLGVPGAEARRKTIITAPGAFTPYFAAPELFSGTTHRTSDEYSLALSYCQLVSGSIPFPDDGSLEGKRGAVKYSQLSFLPEAVKPVMQKALSPDPASRYSNCIELMDSLKFALNSYTWPGAFDGWLRKMEKLAGTVSWKTCPISVGVEAALKQARIYRAGAANPPRTETRPDVAKRPTVAEKPVGPPSAAPLSATHDPVGSVLTPQQVRDLQLHPQHPLVWQGSAIDVPPVYAYVYCRASRKYRTNPSYKWQPEEAPELARHLEVFADTDNRLPCWEVCWGRLSTGHAGASKALMLTLFLTAFLGSYLIFFLLSQR